MKKIAIALGALTLAGTAFAKLPPLSDEAKVKADEAKAKTAWSDKVAAFQLCKSQDKVAAHYQKTKGAKGAASASTCQDPGPFVAPVAGAAPATAVVAAAPAAALAKPAASVPAPAAAKK